jgi:hypothetical protein
VQIKDIFITYRISNPEFKLYNLGDAHGGTVHCVEDDLKRKVNEIAYEQKHNKNVMLLEMGDTGEFITPSDKRFDPDERSIADWVHLDNIGHDETQWAISLYTPIKHCMVGKLSGNHENKMRIFNHENVQQNICDGLEIDNLGYSCFIRFHFKRENSTESHLITGAFTHGSSGAITEGAKLMALMRWMNSMNADIYGYAHIHDYIEKSKTRMSVDDNGKIKARTSYGVTTGAWFRTYTQGIQASYGEIKTFPPTEICCAVFTIKINRDGKVDIQTDKSI